MICRNVVYIFVLIQMVFANNNTAPPKVNVYGKVVYSAKIQTEIHVNCHVESYSTPTIRWYKKNVLYYCNSRNADGDKCTYGHIQQQYWSNITIDYPKTNVKYTCTAENAYGKANDSYTTPCVEGGCLQWDDSLQDDITINVGQHFSITCVLQTFYSHTKQCFKFGVTHHSRSYVKHVSITSRKSVPYPRYWIRYSYDITNALINDTGIYTCYYIKNFTTTANNSQCANPTVKHFNLHVIERQSADNNERNIKIAIAVSVGSVVVGLILIVSIFCLRKKKLKSQRLYESEPDLRWDVFVSYSSKDFDWVKELCKTLEKPPFNLTVCVHQRDWEVGRTILDNMAESIYRSNKTLLIVSKSYLESSFCMQELNMASSTQKVVKDRVILIKLDDVSLKNLPKTLRQKSYLDFSNDEQRKHYKTKLLKALPRRDLEALSEGSGNEEQSEESGNEAQSEGSGNEALSEGSGNEAQFEESGNENMERIPLHEIQNDREPRSV